MDVILILVKKFVFSAMVILQATLQLQRRVFWGYMKDIVSPDTPEDMYFSDCLLLYCLK